MKPVLPKEAYHKNAHVYKILANAKRLEILNLLKNGELPVEEMLKVVRISKANLSQHLALLRHSGLVRTRREGLNVYYKIIDRRIVEPCALLHKLRLKHVIG
jgi:ArsR family transcriptional regulator